MLLKKTIVIKPNIYLLFTLLFVSCYIIPCNLDSGLDELNEEQKDSFFVGKYIVEKSFKSHLKTDNSIIKLKKDGTIEMNSIPVNVFDLIKDDKEINVKGTWRQNFIENRYYLPTNLEFDKKDSVDGGLRTIQVYIKNNKPVLLIEFGDPDECNGIRFIKK